MSEQIEQLIKAKGLNAPRVTPADIEGEIATEWYFTAADGAKAAYFVEGRGPAEGSPLHLLTFCVLTCKNGFTVTGESACASPFNFDAEVGRKRAREKAIEKLWPMLGFRLRDKLAAG